MPKKSRIRKPCNWLIDIREVTDINESANRQRSIQDSQGMIAAGRDGTKLAAIIISLSTILLPGGSTEIIKSITHPTAGYQPLAFLFSAARALISSIRAFPTSPFASFSSAYCATAQHAFASFLD